MRLTSKARNKEIGQENNLAHHLVLRTGGELSPYVGPQKPDERPPVVFREQLVERRHGRTRDLASRYGG